DDTGSGWYKWKGGYFKDGRKGDVNVDGAVTIADVMMTVSHIVGTTQNGFVKPNADVNGDKDINISDVMTIVQMVIN
ncbi:MAG: dockerin type I repeat-containing protein, partial [Bacteroidaceae bacterium]|nr:dockerin type I repeat-containing protein [Bacteroidaceae bacterium]